MQEIGLISKYIQEYGPLIVILAIFLCIVFAIVMYLINTNKKSITSNTEIATAVAKMLQQELEKNSSLLDSHKQNYSERNIVDIFMELNKTLKRECNNTIRDSKSDRVAIYVFHNGTHASHGLPFFKLTCICEAISKNSNANMKIMDHSLVPLSMFDSIISNLYNNSFYRITIGEASDPSELIFLKGTKLNDCFFVPIYDGNNNMMGFTFNGYNTLDNERDLSEQEDFLIQLARMAKPVIEYSRCQEYKSTKEE